MCWEELFKVQKGYKRHKINLRKTENIEGGKKINLYYRKQRKNHRIIEYPDLEGTHECHWRPTPVPVQGSPKNEITCLRVHSSRKGQIKNAKNTGLFGRALN